MITLFKIKVFVVISTIIIAVSNTSTSQQTHQLDTETIPVTNLTTENTNSGTFNKYASYFGTIVLLMALPALELFIMIGCLYIVQLLMQYIHLDSDSGENTECNRIFQFELSDLNTESNRMFQFELSDLPFITISLNYVPIKILLDTGSAISVLPLSVLERLNGQLIVEENLVATAANGSTMRFLGRTLIPIVLKHHPNITHPFYVWDDRMAPGICILGYDAVGVFAKCGYKLIFDLRRRQLAIGPHGFELKHLFDTSLE